MPVFFSVTDHITQDLISSVLEFQKETHLELRIKSLHLPTIKSMRVFQGDKLDGFSHT